MRSQLFQKLELPNVFSADEREQSLSLAAEMINVGRAQAAVEFPGEGDRSTSMRMTRSGMESQFSGSMPR